jgi:5-methylcytosine-specific restriction endonuclease McrA
VQMTIGRETHDKLRRVRDLLRHAIPNGDVAAVFDRALTVLLADLERAKIAATTQPRAGQPPKSGSRHIPTGVRREVWKRDGGQCAFMGAEGRCTERGFLEFHHVKPYAAGGTAEAQNIQLRCRAHNLYEAEQYFEARWPLLAKEARERYGEHSVRTELRNRSRYSVAAMNEGEVADADSKSSAVIEAFY